MFPPLILSDAPETAISPADKLPQPFHETDYLALIEAYHRQAQAKKAAGASCLFLGGMPGLLQARAAVLGTRSAGLPLYVTLAVAGQEAPLEEHELLAALICLQELGIAGFGLDFSAVTGEVLELFTALAPYAKVPLVARPQSATNADRFSALVRAGASLLCCTEENRIAASSAIAAAQPSPRPPRLEDTPLLLCSETGVYYLEEDFTLSEEIDCELDMLEEILEQEDQAVDALCFHITTMDDAHGFGRNAYLARCAVALLAEDSDALEMALTLYNGRALIDARSDLEDGVLDNLAAAYGAIIR